MRDELARASSQFEHEFGAAPRIRGSLHFGPVIIGEIGDVKRAIVFNGDVMNTAARLEELSRTVDGGFLASRAAMERFGSIAAVRGSRSRPAADPRSRRRHRRGRHRRAGDGLILAGSAQPAGFSVTRNPSRGFGIGHICQAGV